MNAGSPPKWGVSVLLPPKEVCMTPWTFASPGSSLHRILQARIPEWVAMPSSKESSQSRSPALQADSLLPEPPGKSEKTSLAVNTVIAWITPTGKREEPASPQSNGLRFENEYCKSLMPGLPAQRRWIRIMLKSELESSLKFPDFRASHLRLALSSTLQPPVRVSVQRHRGAGMPNKWNSQSASVLALNPAIWSVSCYVFTSRNMQTDFSHLSWPAHTRFPELDTAPTPCWTSAHMSCEQHFHSPWDFVIFFFNYPLRSLREGKIEMTIGFRVQRNRIQTIGFHWTLYLWTNDLTSQSLILHL